MTTTATTGATAERRPANRTPSAASRGSRANSRLVVAGPSALSERAIEEYHYVGRDLRNILTLIVIMAVLLVVAFVVFNALGIGHTA